MDKDPLVPHAERDDEILAAFADLMGEVVPDDQDEVEMLLVEANLDPEQIENEVHKLIAEARGRTPLDWRNRQQELEEALSEHALTGSSLPSDRQSLLSLLERLLSQPASREVHAHFRRLKPEELSDEELRSLIQDISFILREAPKTSGEETDQ